MESFLANIENPLDALCDWLVEAAQTEPNDPDAAALATSTADGRPSVRMVLVKKVSADGLVFYTNSLSRKGRELAANPYAALCFHWKSLQRQVRVEGRVCPLPAMESESYFQQRGYDSQLSAYTSKQSQPLASPDVFTAAVEANAKDFMGKPIPRPHHWGGFLLQPEVMELWVQGAHRRHLRRQFNYHDSVWNGTWLYP